jgi:nucleoside 2-deoxyribosyltransferase
MPKIYLAGPISGLSLEEANQWRRLATMSLRPAECINPLRGAENQPDRYFNPNGERWTSMPQIFQRDHHDVMTCDAVLANFIGAKIVSRGTLMELAWAYAYRKPIVMAIEEDNPNYDVFMWQTTPFVCASLDDAIEMMVLLLNLRC